MPLKPHPILCKKHPGCICEHRSIARKVAKKKKRKLNRRTNHPTPPPLLDKRLSSGLVIGSFQMEMASGGAGEQVHPQRSKLQFTRRQEIKRGKGLGVCGWSKGGKRGGPESAISFFSTPPTTPTSTTTTPSIL